MNVNTMNDINQSILKCPNLNLENPLCSRYLNAIPLVMVPVNTQRVLLISRDPSNIANSNNTLTGWDNTFFRQHVLEVFFRYYKKKAAKTNIKYFNEYQKMFHENVYWTHFSKCFPGKDDRGNHNQPNGVCAAKYLSLEIEAVDPVFIVLMGKHSIELITECNNVESINKNGNNFLYNQGKKIPLLCLTHPSNSNNKCKNNPLYKYSETVEMIRDLMEKIYA